MCEQEKEQEGANPNWIFLHGFAGSAADFQELHQFMPHCAKSTISLAGHHGEGDVPSFQKQAEQIAERIAPEKNAILVGYSMGGRLALAATLRAQKSLSALVLLSSGFGIANPRERLYRQLWDEQWAQRIETRPEQAQFEWMAQQLFFTIPEKTKRLLLERRCALKPAFLAQAMRAFGQGKQPPLHTTLPKIRLPVLLVSGALDAKYQKLHREHQTSFQNASCVSIAGAGHAVHLEKPRELAAALLNFKATVLDSAAFEPKVYTAQFGDDSSNCVQKDASFSAISLLPHR